MAGKKRKDLILLLFIWSSALITVAILVGIIGYILYQGLPQISIRFLTSEYSAAKNGSKGILPMIINTVYVVILSLLFAVPICIGGAIYMTQYARQGRMIRLIRFATEVLSGIPSIIYGLFGYAVFVVLFQLKLSILSGSLTMMICILPIIIRTTEESLLAVPEIYREGGLALGAGKLRVTMGIILPSALPGIRTGIVLAVGRIVGETAALLFTVGVSGNYLPKGDNVINAVFGHVFEQGNTLALHLYNSAMNGKDPPAVPFATASALLILVFLINRIAVLASRDIKRARVK
ncbi:MAG: phosphate ABC transporter permease PstA [Clostridiaceae bacterium]|jgi:phosphate transport system permease protein|nr:phosphate ABC transporter permease PstA [Clostridiaceae bacterium]